MSSSEPSAIVSQGIPCMRGIVQLSIRTEKNGSERIGDPKISPTWETLGKGNYFISENWGKVRKRNFTSAAHFQVGAPGSRPFCGR
jgi:hypothetical protein